MQNFIALYLSFQIITHKSIKLQSGQGLFPKLSYFLILKKLFIYDKNINLFFIKHVFVSFK
jgi:hypothetical protein